MVFSPDYQERAPVPVEILHTPSCGRWRAARDAVVRVASEHNIPIVVTETVVATQEQARAHRLPGSPTVRVAGRDVQPEVEETGDYGLG